MNIVNDILVIDKTDFKNQDILRVQGSNIQIAQIKTDQKEISSQNMLGKERVIIPGLSAYLRQGISAVLLPGFLKVITDFQGAIIPQEILDLLGKSGLGFRKERGFHRDMSVTPLLLNKGDSSRPLITLFTEEKAFYQKLIKDIDKDQRIKILGAELQPGDGLVINGRNLHAVMNHPKRNTEDSRIVGTFLVR